MAFAWAGAMKATPRTDSSRQVTFTSSQRKTTEGFFSMLVSRTPEEIFTQRGVIRQTRSASECLARFIFPVQQVQPMPASGPIGLVTGNTVGRNLFKRGKTGGRLDRLRLRYGPPDQCADSWRDSRQTLIEQEYLLPIDPST